MAMGPYSFIDYSQKEKNALSGFEKKMFAEKLKQIVCLLIGCTMEQLEDQTFKETPLGDEWQYWIGRGSFGKKFLYASYADAIIAKEQNKIYKYDGPFNHTPRTLLQLLGTDCGRKIIHPNIWVNSLMVDYQPSRPHIGGGTATLLTKGQIIEEKGYKYPNWIITDLRFENEAEAIKSRGGYLIRVNRPEIKNEDEHESETSLDNYSGFDSIITNTTIENLILDVTNIKKKLSNE